MSYKTVPDLNADNAIALGADGAPKQVEGYYLGFKTTDGTYGPGKLHIFQTAKGNLGVWGKTRLNNLLTEALVGQMVRATFTGMIKATKKGVRDSYGFKVEHDTDNTIEVPAGGFTAAAEEDTGDDVGGYDGADDDLDGGDDTPMDEIVPVRAKAPQGRVPAPTTDSQARLKALLNKAKQA